MSARSIAIVFLFPLAASGAGIDFAKDIYPIFQRSCVECHGQKSPKAGLRLDISSEMLMQEKIIVPGRVAESELFRRISLPRTHKEAMPKRGELLRVAEIARISAWIAEGAVWTSDAKPQRHWAYIPPTVPDLPNVKATRWPINVLDHFVIERLEKEGLTPSAEAAPGVLFRRLSLDLIGLPPSLGDTQKFEQAYAVDPAKAMDHWVDHLLASPEFGVKWARHWLDLARYADSHGFQRDDLREVWAYRDWVVNALNQGMPFDQFTVEQVAGDLLPGASLEQKIATGFHRCTPTNVEAGTEPEESRINQVIDRVNTTGAVWLGITLECAQCHDHKYDAFSQKDYYGLLAYFNNTEAEAERTNPKVPGSIQFNGSPLVLKDPTLARAKAPIVPTLQEPAPTNRKKASKVERREKKANPNQVAKAKDPTTEVMEELPMPRMTTVFKRGEYTQPGEKIAAATPAIIDLKAESSGNRLDLARWLVSRSNPLTARVTVNRWWAEIFGRGIVSTVEDFGIKGEPPTHPELLDWLATDFMNHGWNMKRVIKKIVTSATYRQSSGFLSRGAEIDPANTLFWRGPRFRMDAEMIRDNALSISGLISLGKGGPPIHPPQPDGLWKKVGGQQYDYKVSEGEVRYRRGLYVVLKRGSPNPSFMNFDASARMACVVKRSRSNTPLQALTLLNDPVYVEATEAFALRISKSDGDNPAAKIAGAFKSALAREPEAGEIKVLVQLYDQQNAASGETEAWYAVASAILNLDECITKG